MRRVVWFSLGVAVTVVVVVRGKRMVARYLPAALVDQATEVATDAVDRSARFARDFRTEFVRAFADRESELMAGLLADDRPAPADRPRRDRDVWDDDEDDLGYSF